MWGARKKHSLSVHMLSKVTYPVNEYMTGMYAMSVDQPYQLDHCDKSVGLSAHGGFTVAMAILPTNYSKK